MVLIENENSKKLIEPYLLLSINYFNKKYSTRHTNCTGITITGLLYDLDFNLSPNFGQNLPMQKIVKGNGYGSIGI